MFTGRLKSMARTRHGRFAIVRVDLQRGVHSHCKALFSGMKGLLGGVTSSVANDQDMVAEQIHSVADEHDVLVPVHELQSKTTLILNRTSSAKRAQPSLLTEPDKQKTAEQIVTPGLHPWCPQR